MRAISGIAAAGAASLNSPRPAQDGGEAPHAEILPPPGRDLSVIDVQRAASLAATSTRPAAAFLAQLIATAQKAPQTRQRRRAEPTEANGVYTAAATPAPWVGGAVYRSL